MDENQFWVAVWRTVAVGLVSLSAVIAGCNANQIAAVKSMVKGGANPLDARCALETGQTTSACALRAARQ